MNPLKEEAIRLYAEGLTQREIAKRVGRSRGTVSQWLLRKAIAEGAWTNKERMAMPPPPPADTRTLGARLMGDPLPGRSALDQRR